MKRRVLIITAAVGLMVASSVGVSVGAARRGGDSAAAQSAPTRDELARGTVTGPASVTIRRNAQVVINTVTLQPGASSGWHGHPDGGMLVVTQGVLSNYGLDGAPCKPDRIPAGRAYVVPQHAHHPHLVRNEGTVPVSFVAYYLNVPVGAPAAGPAAPPPECPADLH